MILYTYGTINVAYRASLVCFLGVFALFLGVFSVTLAPVFDLYLACFFLSSLATGMRLKFIWYVPNGFILRPPLKRLRRAVRGLFWNYTLTCSSFILIGHRLGVLIPMTVVISKYRQRVMQFWLF